MNGDKHIDVNGIKYAKYTVANQIPDETLRDFTVEDPSVETVENVPHADIPLYISYLAGDSDVNQTEFCLVYNVPLNEIGYYELSIKFCDFYHNSYGKKTVNFLFNGIELTKNMDMIRHTLDRDFCGDLNVNFWVTDGGTMLKMPGQKDSDIVNQNVGLAACHGSCVPHFNQSNWHISAWSVVKFKNTFFSFPECK